MPQLRENKYKQSTHSGLKAGTSFNILNSRIHKSTVVDVGADSGLEQISLGRQSHNIVMHSVIRLLGYNRLLRSTRNETESPSARY